MMRSAASAEAPASLDESRKKDNYRVNEPMKYVIVQSVCAKANHGQRH
jgi:hypothetical protein